jgi:hypothetical protein
MEHFARTRLANKLDRDFLLDAKTIGNIRGKIHDERFRRHRDDAMSLRYLVEDELGGAGPGRTVFLYQEQVIEQVRGGERRDAPTAARQTVLLDDDPVSVLDVFAEEEVGDASTGAAAVASDRATTAQAELQPRPQPPQPPQPPAGGKAKQPQKAKTLKPEDIVVRSAPLHSALSRSPAAHLRSPSARSAARLSERTCPGCCAGVEAVPSRNHDAVAARDVQEMG